MNALAMSGFRGLLEDNMMRWPFVDTGHDLRKVDVSHFEELSLESSNNGAVNRLLHGGHGQLLVVYT